MDFNLFDTSNFNVDNNVELQRRKQELILNGYSDDYATNKIIIETLRNALAHGRLAMYPLGDETDIVFALEDGIKRNGEFQVRSRMILKKSTLLKWIDIIEKKEL